MGSGDFSLSRGGFGTGVPGNKALQMCVYDGGGRKGGKGRQNERKEEKEKGGGREDYKTETHNMYVLS